jgi:hypothetical protein
MRTKVKTIIESIIEVLFTLILGSALVVLLLTAFILISIIQQDMHDKLKQLVPEVHFQPSNTIVLMHEVRHYG